ncbi:acyl carrier protein phosphodiesterase [Thalassotalea agarivorans]|uniref:Acyl carrier protein phosphodiesterase n=1 Tax=Thalassotalea agarivorans TaxID=349064 RepID=A0A1H9YMC1_THASX|nr:ACP phosphodiesterase [Thalassotalea agarivorans]SES70190.1 Acyl carrier protein phosphodiesterase [Thalassotalea agarivorans]
MNFLAHLFLAQPTPHSCVGNLLGDFRKGIARDAFPPLVLAGLENHYAVDKFTDTHPDILALKSLFSPQKRRFSGIIIDVTFDHFLLKHWQEYSTQNQQSYIAQCYQHLVDGHSYMPASMQLTIEKMVTQDWLSSYQDIEAIGRALNNIANRIRFKNQFQNSLEEINANYSQLEQTFLAFFPALMRHVNSQAIEGNLFHHGD